MIYYKCLPINIWPYSPPLSHKKLSDLDCDLLRSFKVKCDVIIGLLIYDFLLVFTVTWSNLLPLQDISPQNLSDLEFDLSRSLKVNLMVLDSPYMSSY